MQNTIYHVRVIPDLDKDRSISRTMTAQNATEAAGSVLRALSVGPVDCIEVKSSESKAGEKVAFYACVYGMTQGLLYVDRVVVAASQRVGVR